MSNLQRIDEDPNGVPPDWYTWSAEPDNGITSWTEEHYVYVNVGASSTWFDISEYYNAYAFCEEDSLLDRYIYLNEIGDKAILGSNLSFQLEGHWRSDGSVLDRVSDIR